MLHAGRLASRAGLNRRRGAPTTNGTPHEAGDANAALSGAAVWCAVLTGLEPATSALTGRRALQLLHRTLLLTRAPNGIRTRATALKGRRPGPLDDGGGPAIIAHALSDHGYSHPAPPEACTAYVTLGTIAKPHSPQRRRSLERGCGERDRQYSGQPRRVRNGPHVLGEGCRRRPADVLNLGWVRG